MWHVAVGSTELLIDPFFGNPKTDLEPADVDTPDAVLATHGHDDHVADVGAFTETTVAGTPEVVGHLAGQHGIAEDDALGFNLGGTVEVGDAYVTMHRADHTNGMGEGVVAVDWLDVDYAFPMHYDTFPPIEQDPQDFADEVAGRGSDAEVVALDGDESYEF